MTSDRPPNGFEPANNPPMSPPLAGQGTFHVETSRDESSRADYDEAAAAPRQPAPQGSAPAPQAPARSVKRTRTGGIWIGIIVAAIVLILLLIFILQNTASVTIHFFGFAGALPIAVALLLAAVCGVLLVAIPGTVRILQLRKAAKTPTPIARPSL